MNIIEAAAKAHWEHTVGLEPTGFLPSWNELTERSRRELVQSMRAALRAMAECEQIEAAAKAIYYCDPLSDRLWEHLREKSKQRYLLAARTALRAVAAEEE